MSKLKDALTKKTITSYVPELMLVIIVVGLLWILAIGREVQQLRQTEACAAQGGVMFKNIDVGERKLLNGCFRLEEIHVE
jgi:hypothetical protein